MLLHANAALSPIGRRRVVDRVVEEGWSVTKAAGRRVRPHAAQVGGAVPRRG